MKMLHNDTTRDPNALVLGTFSIGKRWLSRVRVKNEPDNTNFVTIVYWRVQR